MNNILLLSVHKYTIVKHVIALMFRCRMISFELVLSFCLYVGSRYQIQVFRCARH